MVPSTPIATKTLDQLYCEDRNCAVEDFPHRVFRECLYRHALPLVPLMGGYHSNFFAADRGLILAAARAVRRAEVREGIVEYFVDPGSRGWFKKRLNLRVSTRRLLRLSKRYLPESNTRPPMGEAQP